MDGILRVSARASQEVQAEKARLHLRVEGETFVLGNAALQRARELRELVQALKGCGLNDDAIEVRGVQAKLNQGLLAKGSKASFGLRVTVEDVGLLGDLIAAVANARHAELERLEWVFDDDQAMLELAGQAMAKAQLKASAMAAAIGHGVVGLRTASDSAELPSVQDLVLHDADWPGTERARMVRAQAVDIGTEFKASRELVVVVNAEFVVKPIA